MGSKKQKKFRKTKKQQEHYVEGYDFAKLSPNLPLTFAAKSLAWRKGFAQGIKANNTIRLIKGEKLLEPYNVNLSSYPGHVNL